MAVSSPVFLSHLHASWGLFSSVKEIQFPGIIFKIKEGFFPFVQKLPISQNRKNDKAPSFSGYPHEELHLPFYNRVCFFLYNRTAIVLVNLFLCGSCKSGCIIFIVTGLQMASLLIIQVQIKLISKPKT